MASWSVVIRIVIGSVLMLHGFARWQITTGWGLRVVAESGVLRNVDLADTAVASLATALLP